MRPRTTVSQSKMDIKQAATDVVYPPQYKSIVRHPNKNRGRRVGIARSLRLRVVATRRRRQQKKGCPNE